MFLSLPQRLARQAFKSLARKIVHAGTEDDKRRAEFYKRTTAGFMTAEQIAALPSRHEKPETSSTRGT